MARMHEDMFVNGLEGWGGGSCAVIHKREKCGRRAR